MEHILDLIHDSYNPGVTEMYVFIPFAVVIGLLLWGMVRRENKRKHRIDARYTQEPCAYCIPRTSNDPNDICEKCYPNLNKEG